MELITALFFIVSVTLIEAQTVRQPGPGVAGNWKLLGNTHANHSADHDVVEVSGPHDCYRKLKFKVTNSPLNLQKMVVIYDDGGRPENIDIRSEIPQGGESREIDLQGGKRKLRSVQYWYDTKGILNGKADVTLFGLK